MGVRVDFEHGGAINGSKKATENTGFLCHDNDFLLEVDIIERHLIKPAVGKTTLEYKRI